MEIPLGPVSREPEVKIHHLDMGGWLRVFADEAVSSHPNLPVILSYAVTQWFRSRPQFRLRAVVSICRAGNTVELHAWYDQHCFPDVSGMQAKATP
jgi:hypothetical protein